MARHKFLISLAAVILVLGAASWWWTSWYTADTSTDDDGDTDILLDEDVSDETLLDEPALVTERRTSHVVSTTPTQGEVFQASPSRVAVTFDTTLTTASTVVITLDGDELDVPAAAVEAGKTLTVSLEPEIGDGIYNVSYHACWEDGACGDGAFGFVVETPLPEEEL